MKVKELIEQCDKIYKDVKEAVSNPDISFSDGVESMRVFLEFLDEEIENNPKPPKDVVPSFYKPPKNYTRNVKLPYLDKWILRGNFDVFTLEMFFKEYPKQRKNNRLNSNIAVLIDKKIITQLDSNGKFRVNRGILK